ncbi:MAG: hypothetical protein LBU90_06805 [Bacteroidales bacterium]|jgi:hypothetical protein|nr:hypothetical protein [Bacteroidales bacterium]
MKKVTMIAAGLLMVGSLTAQDYQDVLRTSEVFPRGNARFMAMSGAMGALGNNMSAISVNPAGSAVARSHAFELTPAFSYIKTENHFQGNYNHRFETAFRLPNMGLMVAQNTPNTGVLSGISYGFTLNNQNVFDAAIRYETPNATSSLTDAALVNAELFGVSDGRVESFQDLFWQSYLLHKDDIGWFTDFTEWEPPTYGQRQTTVITRSGGKNEYLFNFGMDFSQYVYAGANLSIQNLNYSQRFMMEERDVRNQFAVLNNFTYRENLDVSGTGFMGKFGIIVRPIEFFRVGLAYHTPTTFFLTEEFTQRVNANFDADASDDGSGIYHAQASSRNLYDYNITTPGRTIASLGITIKNIAMIGVDYESVNYANAYIDARDFAFTDANDAVADNLQRTDNLKIGAEVSYSMYSFRVGTALYGNPYVNSSNSDAFYRTDISAGVGFRTEGGFYCDLAWVKSTQKQDNFLYADLYNNPVEGNSKIKKTDFAVTLGFRF